MTGEGRVVSVFESDAVVEISKSSACGHDCASCGACSNPTYHINVYNSINASPGDIVRIESDTGKVLGVSFLLYILPVFLLIAAALVCEVYSLGIYSIIIFAVLISVWIVLIRYVNRKSCIKNVITSVISE